MYLYMRTGSFNGINFVLQYIREMRDSSIQFETILKNNVSQRNSPLPNLVLRIKLQHIKNTWQMKHFLYIRRYPHPDLK